MLTIYKASAGSGKTYQLALNYLKILLGVKTPGTGTWHLNRELLTGRFSRSHRRILAITFTNKATEEMKTRIIDNLHTIATAESSDASPFIGTLVDQLHCTFGELQTAARHAMISVLLDFSFFNVSTIDSFFQTIMRTFARELGIQGDYNIEINARNAVNNAVNMLLNDVENNAADGADNTCTAIRQWLDRQSGTGNKKFNIFNRNSGQYQTLIEQVKEIYREDFKSIKRELVDYLDNPDNLRRLHELLEPIPQQALQDLIEAGRKARKAVDESGQASVIISNTDKLINNLCEGKFDPDNLGAGLTRLAGGVKELGSYEYGLKGKTPVGSAYEKAIDDLSEAVRSSMLRYHCSKLLLAKIPQLEFIGLAIKYIDKLCQEDNILILDDTSTYISRIINGSEIPFIYEFLGTRLQHFLIDEFQDTSRLQWHNLLPLVKNSHSEGNDNLIIGDVKQAIYRFRNSDASILGHTIENEDFPMASERRTLGLNAEENRNFRTAHGIVKFNNALIPLLAARTLMTDAANGYSAAEVAQLCADKTAHLDARIEFYPYNYGLSKDNDGNSAGYDLTLDMAERPVIPDEDTKIKVLIDNIRRQHDLEGYKWSDIAILYRSRPGIERPIKALLDAGINVQSSDSLYLKNAASVKLIVSLLNMLATSAMLSPSGSKDKDSRHTDDSGKGDPKFDPMLFESRFNYFLYQGRDKSVTPQEAIDKALDLASDASQPQSPDEILNTILRRHPATISAHIEAILASGLVSPSLIDTEKDYISAFSDYALNYSEVHDNDITGFLMWWEQNKEKLTIAPPAQTDAVQVHTIHSAKGLEFECVHLIDFGWQIVDDRDYAWLDLEGGATTDRATLGAELGVPAELIPPALCLQLRTGEIGFPGSPFRSFFDEKTDLMRSDALNVAYVALTRPVSRLSVYYNKSVKGVKERSRRIGNALDEALTQLMTRADNGFDNTFSETAYNPETGALRLVCAPTRPLSAAEKAERARRLEEEKELAARQAREAALLADNYASVIRADVSSIINVDALDRNEDGTFDDFDSDDLATADIVEARKELRMETTQRGVDLHEILRYIPYFGGEDDTEAVFEAAYAAASRCPGFNVESKDEYRAVVTKLLQTPEAAIWFSRRNRVDTELSYFVPDPRRNPDVEMEMGLTRRIDRLVEKPDGELIIVDYKFSGSTDKKYNRQVQEYIRHISAMFGRRKVTGYLWYCDLGVIEAVEP